MIFTATIYLAFFLASALLSLSFTHRVRRMALERGLVAEPGNAEDLAKQIMVFYRDRELAARYGANARATSLAYDRKTQVARYMAVFTGVHGERVAR